MPAQASSDTAAALIEDARRQAGQITTTAGQQAADIVRKAEAQQAEMADAAAKFAASLTSAAEEEASSIVESARRRAANLRAETDEATAEQRARAELAAQRATSTAADRATTLQAEAATDAERVMAGAQERADRIGAMAVEEARRAVTQAKTDADLLRVEAEELVAEAQRVAGEVKAESERLLEEAGAAAARSKVIVDSAKSEAHRITEEAESGRSHSIDNANTEAKRIIANAQAAAEAKQETDDKIDTWSARLAIAGAVGLTASGEYELARMVGFDWYAAWLLPFVIDIYVIQAFRRHRDILQAITLTIAANVTFHLADKGLFGVEKLAKDGHEPKWWLIALVASIASLILWRMHLITAPAKAPRERRGKHAHPVQREEVSPPVSAQVERPEPPAETPVSAPTERTRKAPDGRGSERPVERPAERPSGRPAERPRKAKSERLQSAQPKPKKSAGKTVAERRQGRVEALYVELGRRPEWTDIRDALAKDRLADKAISRSSCQRIRDAVEADRPHLAALGSANVRPITGIGQEG
ncbi:hypothetical protein G3I39_24990 [Streptomyces fulvissimus]|uniref:Uncharacterized protein n=1 Tax=Streptomyces microflavus TaxID=1919 RepID=A0A6N9VFA9_STRMI|nr:hypothetical protein [Streptomyces microflavus]NEB70285.1 hypothetical protein [Streptomyces microflavus]NEE45157.1 hypothetical protein [Streptomyces sp. SID8455]